MQDLQNEKHQPGGTSGRESSSGSYTAYGNGTASGEIVLAMIPGNSCFADWNVDKGAPGCRGD